MAMRQLPAQITDVVTSLASGMPVWLVAIQQGGQIKDMYGNFEAWANSLNPQQLADIAGTAPDFGTNWTNSFACPNGSRIDIDAGGLSTVLGTKYDFLTCLHAH